MSTLKNETTKHAIFNNLDGDQAYELKDSYYGITDNIDGVIEGLELALLNENNNGPHKNNNNIARLEAELATYKHIKMLLANSHLGAAL